MLKTAPILHKQSGTSGRETGTVSKVPRPITAEPKCDVVHCQTVGKIHWMFDPLLAYVVN